MHPSATIYKLPSEHSIESLEERLSGYESTEYREEIDDEVITTFDSISSTERGFSFVIDHDYVEHISVRDSEEPVHVKATLSVQGRFCKDIGSDGFILIGSNHETAAKPVTEAIEGGENSYLKLNITPNTITKIVGRDSYDARYQIWEDIDTFTDMASIKGRIEDSTYSQDFDEFGRAVWAMFDSNYLGETVGISKSGFVVYGSDVDPGEMESYYFDIIKEAIEN